MRRRPGVRVIASIERPPVTTIPKPPRRCALFSENDQHSETTICDFAIHEAGCREKRKIAPRALTEVRGRKPSWQGPEHFLWRPETPTGAWFERAFLGPLATSNLSRRRDGTVDSARLPSPNFRDQGLALGRLRQALRSWRRDSPAGFDRVRRSAPQDFLRAPKNVTRRARVHVLRLPRGPLSVAAKCFRGTEKPSKARFAPLRFT